MKKSKYVLLKNADIRAYEYIDCFGDKWFAIWPFLPWSHRSKMINDDKKLHCNFDHNSKCLACNCLAGEFSNL
jgi:hypothetical protein